MKVKLKILECVNFNFFMLYLLVFELSVACSGPEFELHYIIYITLHYIIDHITGIAHVSNIVALTRWCNLCRPENACHAPKNATANLH
jgi:hypothetical protein